MKSITKKITKLLSLVLVISFIFSSRYNISNANSDLELVFVVIYEDSDRTVSIEIPKNLSNNEMFLNKVRNDYLNTINSSLNLTTYTLKGAVTPFYITPEQPPKPARKLLSRQRWYKNDIIARLKEEKRGAEILRRVGSSNLAKGTAIILDILGAGGYASLGRVIFNGYNNYLTQKSQKWLSESLSMIIKGQIRYVEQRIYQNLAGDYPKIFIETVRGK